ncbi:MAG TPA: hypothetical protein VJZ70_00555 [Limnochordia bacterium]|nr:hypothetical protein [Limnochordia bacterium]
MRKFGIVVIVLLLIAALALMVASAGIVPLSFFGSQEPSTTLAVNMPFSTSLENEEEHALAARPKLEVNVPHGQIIVTGADVDGVQIHMHVQTRATTPFRAQEIMGKVSLEMDTTAGGNTLQVQAPRLGNNEMARTDLTILVPVQTQLDLKTNLGQVEITNIEGTIRVLDKLGTIKLKDARGDAYLETSLGNIEISNSTFEKELVAFSHLGDLIIEASLARSNVLESSLGDLTLLLSPEESYVLEGTLSLGSFNVAVPFKGQQSRSRIQGIIGEGEQLGSIFVDLSLGSLAVKIK